MDITLAVMAAGMGSRFGGLKQIEPVGPNGEVLLDYSVYDAIKAGYSKIVFIIKREIEKDFREIVGNRIEKIIDVDYAFQSIDDIPVKKPEFSDRQKPWGTGQAILSAKNVINTPFVVLNADDFYGREAFRVIGDYLKDTGKYCLAGYRLKDTLTDNGTVTRGVCSTKDGYLETITECYDIDQNSGFDLNCIVSMNMWGLETGIFDVLENGFADFLNNIENPLKSEYLIPNVMNTLAQSGTKIRVLDSSSKWLGMTYREDLPAVRRELENLKNLYI